jgi:phage replication O-like protein O
MNTKKTKWEVNAFQVPNVLVDEYISELSGNAFKLLVFIIRKTKGWNKTWDAISACHMAEVLNLKVIRNVYPYIKELETLKLIKLQKRTGRVNKYALHIPVSKTSSAKKDTSDEKEQLPVLKTSTSTSVKKVHSLKETNKETNQKEKSISKSQMEIINSFVPDESSCKVVVKKYPTIDVNADVLEDLTDTFKDSMKNRKAPWKDIQATFRNYVKGEYIELTQPSYVIDDRPKLSYAERLREMENQAAQVTIEGEAV